MTDQQLHIQVRYVPSQQCFRWEIGHQKEGALSFDLPPREFAQIVEYLGQSLKNRPETQASDQFMSITYLAQKQTFRWQIGPDEGVLSLELDSGNLARVLEYLETVQESVHQDFGRRT